MSRPPVNRERDRELFAFVVAERRRRPGVSVRQICKEADKDDRFGVMISAGGIRWAYYQELKRRRRRPRRPLAVLAAEHAMRQHAQIAEHAMRQHKREAAQIAGHVERQIAQSAALVERLIASYQATRPELSNHLRPIIQPVTARNS